MSLLLLLILIRLWSCAEICRLLLIGVLRLARGLVSWLRLSLRIIDWSSVEALVIWLVSLILRCVSRPSRDLRLPRLGRLTLGLKSCSVGRRVLVALRRLLQDWLWLEVLNYWLLSIVSLMS